MKRLPSIAAPFVLLVAIACGGPTVPAGESAASAQATALPPQAAPSAAVPVVNQPAPSDPGQAVPAELAEGASLYTAQCASCHGESAMGTDKGPAFLHPVYVPGHHPDQSFVIAALNGVRAHHWQFGDMPPVEGATEGDVLKIVAYVRWLQQQAQ